MNPLGARIGEISGQVVYLASGFNTVDATVNVAANVSGNTIRVQAFDPSGNSWRDLWVNQSGGNKLQVDASVTANADISGQTVVAEVSGEKIRLQGFDPSGNVWRDLIVNQSGSNILRVDPGSISVSSNISGQTVYLTSGQNTVQTSISGNSVNVGNTVTVQGTVSTDVSGTLIRNQFFDPSGNVWRDAWIERSGGHRLLVTNSGDSVNIGNTVTVQGTVSTSVSGNSVDIGNTPIAVTLPTNPISGQSINVTSGLVAINGTVTVAGAVTTSVSGNNIVVSSGTTLSKGQAFDPSGGVWRDMWMERSGGNRLLVTNSGDSVQVSNTVTVQGTITANTSVSGNVVDIGNTPIAVTLPTNPISGQSVNVTSGQVAINGTVTVAGAVTTSVSGNNVVISSGTTLAKNQAFDPSGNTWRDLWVERSGGNRLLVTNSGDSVQVSNTVTVQGTVTANTSVSGNTVNIGNTPIAVTLPTNPISGQSVNVTSGLVAIDGTVTVAGAVTTSVSGNNVVVSSGTTLAKGQAFDPSGNTWRDLWMERSGGNRLLVTNSGDTVNVGNTVAVTLPTNPISGQSINVTSGLVAINGTVTVAGTVSTSVSGNVVRAETSGQMQRVQAFDPSGNTWQDLWVSQSGGHDLRVNASVQASADISGQTVVAETSGQKQRLQAFDPSGNSWRDLWMNASGGNKLQVDATVQAQADISGQTVVSEVSGQKIRLQGFDPSGNVWRDLIVNASGSNILRVDAGSIQVAANVSGNVVYLTSGQNNVQNSGQKLRAQMFDPSGNEWRDLWNERSGGNRLLVTNSGDSVNIGNTVTVQGTVNIDDSTPIDVNITTASVTVDGTVNTITPISGGSISGVSVITQMSGGSMSGQAVNVTSGEVTSKTQFFDPSGAVWRDSWVNVSGGHKLQVTASGDTVNVGNTVAVTLPTNPISGQSINVTSGLVAIDGTVTIAGAVTTSVSGNHVIVSSGTTLAKNQAFDPSGAAWRDLWVERSGGNKLLVTNSGDTVNVGNTVAVTLPSNPISGQSINVTSGLVAINGTVTIAGAVTTSVSGNHVIVSSGTSLAKGQAFDPSGATWRDLWMERSGGNRLLVTNSGDSVNVGNTVTVQGTVNIDDTTPIDVNITTASVTVDGTVNTITPISGGSISGVSVITQMSGGSMSGQSVNTSVSGNNVVISSGTTLAKSQFFDPSGNTWRDAWVERSGGNRLLVTNSGDSVQVSNTVTVQGTVTANTSVSGNSVNIGNTPIAVTLPTNPISGQSINVTSGLVAIDGTVTIAGAVTTSISGNTIRTASGFNAVQNSGQTLRVQAFDPSGTTWQDLWVSQSGGHDLRVNASVTADISGQTVVAETSGNKIRLQGFDPSGNTWNDLIVNASGSNILRVDAGTIDVSANVSGNVVYLTSGQNAVQNSGQKIRLQAFDPSGNTWNDLIVNQSGGNKLLVDAGSISANVSGNVVYLTSGQNETLSNARAFDPSGATWRNMWVERSGGNRLLATISGDAVTIGNTININISGGSISGVSVITQMSGGSISGARVSTSGDAAVISGQPVTVSGNLVGQRQMAAWRSFAILSCTAASGGTSLLSGISSFVTIKNNALSGGFAQVGFSGTSGAPWVNSGGTTPSSGVGITVNWGESITIPIDNPLFVQVAFPTAFSGSKVSYMSVSYA